MSKAGGTNAAPVRSVRTIATWHAFRPADGQGNSLHLRNEINSHLSLRCFDGRVGFAGWDGVALAEELEVVNKRLHTLLHRGTGWWHELVVVDPDGTLGDLVQTLRSFLS